MAFENGGRQITDLAQVRADLEQIMQPLGTLRTSWESLEPPFRSRFERLILPGGFVIGQIRTAAVGLLFSVFRASVPTDSGVVPLASSLSNLIISEIHEFARILCSTGCTDEELPIAV
jgi:hypothetical protein